ncbi:alpha/beta hydrolase [Aquimarina sp. AD10]|uniref:alpha/beta fold hydrolase n=1 Tax=Aquimarina sp. AD10 TaxID=1714849 RepID=UPI000E49868D|nr:alpha/beta hydrolase [Aquimarina sp. AD10]AXT61322.1 alpha/beta hydrolase [Aquimarina sp. AD10]RKN01483.1 alpha/beta fold hydrolase [Aquimarina sp. AD10]
MKQLIVLLTTSLLISCNQPVTSQKENVKEKQEINMRTPTTFKTKQINGLKIAYREAGDPKNPTIVLFHGFPSSSHQYRKVLRELSDQYHLIAPDYPGFGESDFPAQESFEYTFDNLAKVMDAFLESFSLNTYSIMIQDYGAPIGLRIATAHPEKITAIINQNGNAYEEGLGEAWAGVRALWKNKTSENEKALLPVFSLDGLKWQYTHGTRNPENINPDCWNLDYLRLSRPNAHRVNLDLFYDYQNNLKLYPIWQKYLRDNQPPLLIVWGKNDAFFPESGAQAFKKDVKNIDFNIYNTGHFALEEDGDIIIKKIRTFMGNLK